MDLCRKKGCARLILGDTEIIMGAPPASPADKKNGKGNRTLEARRAELENLLNRSVTDEDLENYP